MPYYNNKYEDIGIEEQLKEESVLRKEDGFSIFTNDTETWLSLTDAIEDDKMPDFHTFWKGEENAKNIREARGISKISLFILRTIIIFVSVKNRQRIENYKVY